MDAAVDAAGNLAVTKRSTLTRMAAGGVLLGPVGLLGGGMMKKTQKHDTRELYLLIETPTFVAALACKPDDGAKVRAFAAKVKTAYRSFPTQEQRVATVQKARAQIDALRAMPQS